MRVTLLLLAVFLLPVQVSLQAGGDELLVPLRQGSVRGQYVTVRGTERRARQFLGIPFARAPVGPLRLAPPLPAEPWAGERDASQQPPMCVQDPEILANLSQMLKWSFVPPRVSEDCLYLNVFTPADAKRGDNLPVMVWIHGGGLRMGAASLHSGAPLAAYENIVTVFIQYRLGFLGFLSTADRHARGNWGFLDQLVALEWVRDNIQFLGGDPGSVTVAGESAGGISASVLTLSPRARGLFQRAVFQSGVATLGMQPASQAQAYAKVVAGVCGCDSSSSQVLVQCLREKSEADLLQATIQMDIYLSGVVDGDFLPDEAEELLKRQEVMKIPVMMGTTNHEFGWLLPQAFAPPGWETGMSRESVLEVMNRFYPDGAAAANSLIAEEYLRGAATPQDVRDAFTELMGDLLMTLPMLKVAGYHADAGHPVYVYEFVHSAQFFRNLRPSFVKADHSDDVIFMSGICFLEHAGENRFTQEDEQLCRDMMSYWANFIRTGSPSGPGLVDWPRFSRQTQDYMELGPTQTVKHKLREERARFISVTLPQRLQQLAAAAE